MLPKGIFKKPHNALEGEAESNEPKAAEKPRKLQTTKCPSCGKSSAQADLLKNLAVCPYCGYHMRMCARERIASLVDPDSFLEQDRELCSSNLLDFPGYDSKLEKAKADSGENEAVLTGTAQIEDNPCALFVMEPYFMMGSMGTVVGEKITRLFEYATAQKLHVIGYTVSGGARMQEGILSLLQMAKVSGAVKRHSDAGLCYVTVLTDPTTGGVTASFAMQGDIILAEPDALIGFAGPRVISQTIREKLPDGFQTSSYLYDTGFVDEIVVRHDQRTYLSRLLRLHRSGSV